jgi:hypothetical protein
MFPHLRHRLSKYDMHHFVKLFVLSISLMLLVNSAKAVTTDDEMCRNGLFPSLQKDMRIATFAGEAKARLYFFNDMDGCPSHGAECQSKSYVVPGDELIVGKQHGDWSCVWYAGKTHETVGWVLNRQLRFAEPEAHPNWNGKWKQYAYPGYISIARKADSYFVLGNMKWIGAQLADGSRVEHLGELEGELRVENNRAYVGASLTDANDTYTCGAELLRVGKFLVVHDNAQCGGMNVRFDGVYTMAASK